MSREILSRFHGFGASLGAGSSSGNPLTNTDLAHALRGSPPYLLALSISTMACEKERNTEYLCFCWGFAQHLASKTNWRPPQSVSEQTRFDFLLRVAYAAGFSHTYQKNCNRCDGRGIAVRSGKECDVCKGRRHQNISGEQLRRITGMSRHDWQKGNAKGSWARRIDDLNARLGEDLTRLDNKTEQRLRER